MEVSSFSASSSGASDLLSPMKSFTTHAAAEEPISNLGQDSVDWHESGQ